MEKDICADWMAEFPGLKRFRNGRRLLKRHGPIVVGIELEKGRFSDTEYRPNFIAMSLLDPYSDFTVNRTLVDHKEPQVELSYVEHGAKYKHVCELMREQALLDLQPRKVAPSELRNLYRKDIESLISQGVTPMGVWLGLIFLEKYFGEDAAALRAAEELHDYAIKLNPAAGGGLYKDLIGDHKMFSEKLNELEVETLLHRMQENSKKGGWDKIIDYGISSS